MNNSYLEHIDNINSIIEFLKQYKNIIENNSKKFQNSLFSENFYLADNHIENLKDRLLQILNIDKDCDYGTLNDEIKDCITVNKNIKEVMPLIIGYFLAKNDFNFYPEDL